MEENVKLRICNEALSLLGREPISRTTEKTPAAVYCSLLFDGVLEELLRVHSWSFARKRFKLNLIERDGREFIYQKPADCIVLLRALPDFAEGHNSNYNSHSNEYESKDYYIVGDTIISYREHLKIEYISKEMAEKNMDSLFRRCFVYSLAERLTEPLHADGRSGLTQEIQYFLQLAIGKSTQESGIRFISDNPYSRR